MKSCRMCKNKELEAFLDLGFHPPSDAFLKAEDLHQEEKHYPLNVQMCKNCGLMQLGYVVPASNLYGKNYIYESSMTSTGKEHFFGMAKNICESLKIQPNSLVVDVGSNVGVLLSGFKEKGMNVLGVDPAETIAKIANNNGVETWCELFTSETAKKIVEQKGKASVLTATNVFMHIDDLYDFAKAIDHLLTDDGVFVTEAPYFIDLMENLEYDTVYLEHLGYISVKPLTKFFPKFDLEVFDIQKFPIHGGSLRVFVGRKGKHQVTENVQKFLDLEDEKQIYSSERLQQFAKDVKQHKEELFELLYNLKKQGKRIVGISAPAKGNTLLNYCKISNDLLDYLTEKSQIKIGLYSPGMHIPIMPDEQLFKDKPDYALILAWNFADEIMNNLKAFKEQGGKFIIPVPKPRIVD